MTFGDAKKRIAESRPLILYAVTVCLAAWAILNLFLTLRSMIWDYNPLPYWDYWGTVLHLERYKRFDLSVLWLQHNEHRIVFPELIFALDILCFGGVQIFAMAVSLMCYAGVWWLLARAFTSDQAIPSTVRISGCLLAGIVMGWNGNSAVLGNTFLLQWTMSQVAATLALSLLALSARAANPAYLAGTIAAAVVTTYSSGNGMLLWPVLIAGAILLEVNRKRLLILAISGVISIAVYFAGYRMTNHLQFLTALKHPLYALGFACAYLSMPLGAFGYRRAIFSGAFNLLAFATLFAYAARYRLLKSRPAVVLFGVFLFTVATASLTALGRMNIHDPQFIAATAARYVSVPLVNWAALLLAALWLSARLRWRLVTPLAIILATLVCVYRLNHSLKPWVNGNGTYFADRQVATVAAENGITADADFMGKLFIDPTFIARELPVLERNHSSIYAKPYKLRWLGRKLGTVFHACEQREPGGISETFPVVGGTEVVGYAPSARLGLARNDVVFVNQEQTIVGFGNQISAGTPTVVSWAPPRRTKPWVGFINDRFGVAAFSTFVIRDGGTAACPLSSFQTLPRVKQVTGAELGPEISNVTWTGSGWQKNNLPADAPRSSSTLGDVWATWNGSDQSTGKLMARFAAPKQGCIVLPVLHGPSVHGLRIQLEDAGAPGMEEDIPLRTDEDGWKFWKVRFPANVHEVFVQIDDAGSGWGQWVAAATPRACR